MTLTKQARWFNSLEPGDRVRVMHHGTWIPATLLHRANGPDGGWRVLHAERGYGDVTRHAFDDDVRPYDTVDLGPFVTAVVRRAQLFEAAAPHLEGTDVRRAADRFAADVITILWPTFDTWGAFTDAVAARTSDRWVYDWLMALDDVDVFDEHPFWHRSRTTTRRESMNAAVA